MQKSRGASRRVTVQRVVILSVVPVVIVLGMGAVGAAWVWAGRMVDPRPSESERHLSDYPALKVEAVSFESATGVRIAGRFFPGATGATIVVTHGYGGSQDEMLPVVNLLVDQGFSVLTYSTRGNGGSGGKATLGKLETRDLISAVDYVVSRPDTDPDRIGAFGFSAGGAMTAMAAARDTRIRAVVVDSGWSDARHWLGPGAERSFHGVKPLASLALRLLEFRAGVRLTDLRPVAVVGNIAPRPLLFIHGREDSVVPATDAEENFMAAGAGKQLWLLPDAGHSDTISLRDSRYRDRVGGFFQQALGR